MKTFLSAVGISLSAALLSPPVYACAVPRPFFYSILAADVVVRAKMIDPEAFKHERGSTEIEVFETLKGDVANGRLLVRWNRRIQDQPSVMPEEVLVTLKRVFGRGRDDYELMSGCMVQAVYWTPDEKRIAVKVLERSPRRG